MNISFSVPPQCIVREDPDYPGGHWLPCAQTNPAKNCLSVKDENDKDDIALVWRDEGADEESLNKMTFEELRAAVWYVTPVNEEFNILDHFTFYEIQIK